MRLTASVSAAVTLFTTCSLRIQHPCEVPFVAIVMYILILNITKTRDLLFVKLLSFNLFASAEL